MLRDGQLLPEERQSCLDFYARNTLESYRRLIYLMFDADVVYASPSTTYRVLLLVGVLISKERRVSKKGKKFRQPEAVHKRWHKDA